MESFVAGFLLGLVLMMGLFLLVLGHDIEAHGYRRGWCNAQGAQVVGGRWCITSDGRAFPTAGVER